jgi:UDP-GlcNAc:undecaprenyl-phosphate/decaprenyl-phosphate GlcNAc-1-phosphate transferase
VVSPDPSFSLLLLVSIAGFAASAILVSATARAARRFGWIAYPTVDRWHERPVAKFGGAAIFAALALVAAAAGLLDPLAPLATAVTLMFLLGTCDDIWPMRALTRLGCQVAVAMVLLWSMPAVTITGIEIVDVPLALVWLVGVTNAMNLLDNMDGLAAGVAAIAAAFLLVIVLADGGAALAPLAVAIAIFAGVALGFVCFNFQPASIFMGDGGSYLIGSFLAGATLLAGQELTTPFALGPVVQVLLLLVPIADTTLVTVVRVLEGRSAFAGGRDHMSHRFVALGVSEREAVLLLYGLSTIAGVTALIIAATPTPSAWLLVLTFAGAVAALASQLVTATSGAGADGPGRPATQRDARTRA